MRPITTSFSGGFLLCAKLLDEPRGSVGKDRALRLPVRQALAVDAQPLLAFRRLRIVEADALDETAVARTARVGHDHVEERALLRAAACQPYHHHVSAAPKMRKGRDFTLLFRQVTSSPPGGGRHARASRLVRPLGKRTRKIACVENLYRRRSGEAALELAMDRRIPAGFGKINTVQASGGGARRAGG